MEGGSLIVIICSSFPPEGGGASARIYNLAILLRNAGYRVQIVCAMPNYPTGKIFPAYKGRIAANEVVDGVAVRRVWLSPSNAASALSRSWSMISFILSLKVLAFRRIRKQKPALVIVSSPPLPMASAAVRYFKKRGFKVLLNVSDIWPLSAKALGVIDRSRLYKQLEGIARRMYKAADAITAQSNETLAHIAHHCSPMPPSMLYRNLPAAIPAENPASLPETGKVKIVYPGLLGHAQGLLALCKAIDFGALQSELHIYGEGTELEAIRAFIEARPERAIFLYNPVPLSSLPEVLASAHAVLIPLVAPIEGALPSKLFTAMQSGVPVLYSGGGEGADIVSQYQLGFVADPGDYNAIAAQIPELRTISATEHEQWRFRIRDAAEKHFSKERQDQRLLHFISGVLAPDEIKRD